MNKYTLALLYIVYFALLATLLPHTAWAFSRFEPDNTGGAIVAWAAAFAFEAAIAALTMRQAKRIESTPRRFSGFQRWSYQYVNAYGGGLVLSLAISALANLAHAVEYGGTLEIFQRFGIPFSVYAIAFGGILPLVSLLFANVLSNDTPDETELKQKNNSVPANVISVSEIKQSPVLLEENPIFVESAFICSDCAYEAKSQKALNGHRLKHRVKVDA